MNHTNRDVQARMRLLPRQQGVVLLVMLALLFIATLLGIALVTSTMGETRMASLRSQREFSHTLAEAGASAVALKALNDPDPNQGQGLSSGSWDCTTLGWQGGMGSATQPGACTVTLEAQGSYSGLLKINAGTSETMANQLRAQAAVVPLLSGIGAIIGAPGRAGFVVAATTGIDPDPAAADPANPNQDKWLKRDGAWHWSENREGQGKGSMTLAKLPTPSNLPTSTAGNPWTNYVWAQYNRDLGSDAVRSLKERAEIKEGTEKEQTVSQRYQKLKDQYKNYIGTKNSYATVANAAMVVALSVDAAGQIVNILPTAITAISNAVSALGLASGVGSPVTVALQAANAALGVINQASGAFTSAMVDSLVQAMDSLGKENIKAAVAVIEARNSIRSAWNETADDFALEEGGKQAVWQCDADDAQRDEPDTGGTLQKMKDKQFKDDSANSLKNPPSDSGLTSVIQDITTVLGSVVNGDNVKKVNDEKDLLGGIADGSEQDPSQNAPLPMDPIGSVIQPGWEEKIEPKFMLVQGDGGGFIQTNPMCATTAELVIQAIQANTGATAPTPGNEPKVVNATIVHTGAVTFKAEAPLYDDPITPFVEKRVTDILVSNGKITVASDQQDQSGQAGVVLWSDKDISINRPVSGAAVAGGTVTVDPTDKAMLTYNPAVDVNLLGNGKFPLAGYTLGSWTSLASAP